jgi:hypothetical protein
MTVIAIVPLPAAALEPMRPIALVVLCAISAAVGASADHYWTQLSSLAGLDWGKPTSSVQANAPDAKTTTANRSAGRDEVLGDRVRCDVRYQELKLPESEYRAFFDHCMGNTASTNK